MQYETGDKVISKIGATQRPEGAWTGPLTIKDGPHDDRYGTMYRATNEEGREGMFYEENLLPLSTESMFRKFSDADLEAEVKRRQKAKRDEHVENLTRSASAFLEDGGFAIAEQDNVNGIITLDLSEYDN